jgi:diacylglycerol kinase (ATP)
MQCKSTTSNLAGFKMNGTGRKFFFVINPGSGSKVLDWESVILDRFKTLPHQVELYHLPKEFTPSMVRTTINSYNPHHVIAVGGDGTVNLLAGCVMNTGMSLGILPAGSANGMARELGINDDVTSALDTVIGGTVRKISVVEINGRISIHLSDIGLNAYMVKEFEKGTKRGLRGYLVASVKALWKKRRLTADLHYNGKTVTIHADIVLIANATMYGTGVIVNPVGSLHDDVFEVIAIKDLSVKDLLKTSLRTLRLDESKATIYQVSEMRLHVRQPVHFQVDGEYLGKVQDITARLIPNCLAVLSP